MKFLRIFLCVTFVFVLAACGGKKSDPYDIPDEDTIPEKGDVGDPCMKNGDCKEGLFCIDKVCSEPSGKDDSDNNDDADSDINDDDTDSGTNDDDTDTDGQDDTDTDTQDDTDTDDKDDYDDSDTQTDDDIPVYIPECGNGLRDPGEECDNGPENSDEPGITGITCRTDCYFARCGDNILDSGELCDDGNFASGDYCSPDCNIITGYCGDGIKQSNEACDPADDPYCADDCSQVTGFCGDGTKQANEICDNAEPNIGNGEGIGPYYCNVSCSKILGSCGDGKVQLNEACDDGNNNGRYGYCSSDCSGPGERCGDGIKQSNEACDDGNTTNGDYCSADCQTSYGSCGDGIIQSFEACDKAKSGDGIGAYCSNNCKQIIGSCGDGTTQRENCNGYDNCTIVEGLNEECDLGAGNNNQFCPYGSALGCTVCSTACKNVPGIPRYCGDGIVSTLSGEVCDKAEFGEGIGQHYCSSDCTQIIGRCGDGIKQPNETCDDGNNVDGDYCSSDCKTVTGECGDGQQQINEECDLGVNNGKMKCEYGKTSCKVCTNECTTADGNASYCGDGIRDTEYGEVCDSGSNNGHYGYCKGDCSGLGERCGDGIKQEGLEECDNGENNGKTECEYGPKTCTVCTEACRETSGHATYCGDGIKNGNETCDEGELNGTYGHCPIDCRGQGERCGDGIPNGDEICDDGDELNGTYGHCKSDCSGLGMRCGDGIKQSNETCDDGSNNGKYKREAPGYCNSTCDGYGEGGYCGDEVENGTEECDYGEDNGLTDCPYGKESCKVCNSNCRERNGNPSYCGDGIRDLNHGEVCDDGPRNTQYGPYCKPDCSGPAPKCGDEHTDNEFGEICDEGTNNGKYSAAAPGTCNSDCKGRGEGGFCGDNHRNGYETCDDGTNNGQYGGYCNSNCNGYMPYCGDGYTDSSYGENCDDGNLNGTYNHCNDNCSAILKCGDSIVNGDEDCDEGENTGSNTDCAYGETECIVCSDSCKNIYGNTSYCGDDHVDEAHETCDDGTNNGNYGYCNSSCTGSMPKCGDGHIDTPYGETCDDGELNGTYGHCNIGCNGTVQCGDGIKNGSEYCDDGPLNNTYGHCNESCTAVVGSCGDGIWHNANCGGAPGCIEITGGNENCDNGSLNGRTSCNYGETECYVCTNSCESIQGTTSFCGDGHVDEAYETCDEGSNNGTYGHCNDTCSGTVSWRCGDGNIDYTHGETCDDGDGVNGTPEHCNSTCDGRTPYCGDGIIQRENCSGFSNCVVVEGMNEACDDRYMNGTTGYCHNDCSGRCGDGEIQSSFEVCDDGDELNGNEGHCNATCTVNAAICGNGILEDRETCDEGEKNGKYGHCNSDCAGWNASGRCGDGKLQVTDLSDCGTFDVCDGVLTENCCEAVAFAEGESSETCDEGDKNNGYHGHCNETCDGISSCGDGVVGKDEICEKNESLIDPSEDPISCSVLEQFESGTFSECDSNCMLVLSDCTYSTSYMIPFFKTGQTKCYNDSAEMTCPTTGDFYGQEPNFTYTPQNFQTIANGTVLNETVSGLMWQTDTPAYYGFEKGGNIIYDCANETNCTLEEASRFCYDSYIGEYNGWRLPTASEFSTIMDYEAANHIYSGFTNTNGAYWTTEGVKFSTSDGTSTADETGTAQVKCVRFADEMSGCTSIQCIDEHTLLFDFPDSIITVYGEQTFIFWYFGNPKSSETWEDALDFCNNADNGSGLNKMRLPTVNELMSLINRKNGSSLIPGFTGKAWTSTTVGNAPSSSLDPLYSTNPYAHAYAVDFSTGNVVTDTKDTNNIVICVE